MTGNDLYVNFFLSFHHSVLEGDIISKEISKRESALRNAQMLLEEKDLEIEMLKGDLESIGRERDDQSELFRQEKQSLMQQLQSLEGKYTHTHA